MANLYSSQRDPAKHRYGPAHAKKLNRGIAAQKKKNLLRFADLISGKDDERHALSPAKAADILGYEKSHGKALLKQICSALGPQAK